MIEYPLLGYPLSRIDNLRVSKSVFTDHYAEFLRQIIEARKTVGLTQVQLSKRLMKPQSFVSKYENGERRLDIIEFLQITGAMQIDPVFFLKKLVGSLEAIKPKPEKRK